ncbi:MAG: glycine--tRNA ligase subunit beta, partial [Hyphomicrobium sp.]|nr:glycine--tRNA ligase subunit beta [Hyphomicrobium sp.]
MRKRLLYLVGLSFGGFLLARLLRKSTSSTDAGVTVTGAMARNAAIAKTGARVGASYAAHQAKRVAATPEKQAELDAAFELKTAEEVVQVLGNMKGALMKIGQMASFLDDGLPEPIREALATLQADAPPMSAALAAGVVEQELGAAPDKIFAEWDETPLSAASIGQVHRAVTPGAPTAHLMQAVLDEALAAMPIPKPMRWGDHAYGFARPLHWLVALLGGDVAHVEVLGVRAGRNTRGHRFHHPAEVAIAAPGDYVDALRTAKVLVDPDERRDRIVAEVEAAAKKAGGSARIEADNLAQVNCLNEWPVAVACSFEHDFLPVPQEALVATMETNQKFFPVLDDGGRLTAHFIGIANIDSKDPSEIRKGYERVIRPRFADARFFFDEDLKQGLEAMGDGLKTVTYQAKLGSVADKAQRVAALAEAIAPQVGVDPALARRAA